MAPTPSTATRRNLADPGSSASSPTFVPYDPSFGHAGVIEDFASAFHYRLGLHRLEDGRLLVAGHRGPEAGSLPLAVAVYTAEGKPDPSFGDGGMIVLGDPPSRAALVPIRLAVQRDGKYLISTAGEVAGAPRWTLIRLTSTGRLDPSFSGDGRLQVSFPGDSTFLALTSVLVADDDTILLVGFAEGSRLCAARHLPDGSLDRAFGDEGKLQVQLPGGQAQTSAAAFDADGRLLVAGSTRRPDSGSDVLVARFTADLVPDPSFGFQGTTLIDFGLGTDFGAQLVVQTDGRVIVAGGARAAGGGTDPALLRLRPDGTLDPGFGQAGLRRLETGQVPDRISVGALRLLSDGRLALAGDYTITDPERKADPNYRIPQPFVAVLRSEGAPDPGFDAHIGLVFLGRGTNLASTNMVVVPGDKLLVATRRLSRLVSSTEFSALRLTIGAAPNPAGPGVLRFFVTVTNDGRETAGGVLRLRASQPVVVESGTNGSYVVDRRVDVLGKLRAVPPGGTATVTLRTTVTGFEEGVSLSGAVAAGSAELDLADNVAEVTVTTSRVVTM